MSGIADVTSSVASSSAPRFSSIGSIYNPIWIHSGFCFSTEQESFRGGDLDVMPI
jgi:hypothetical protein